MILYKYSNINADGHAVWQFKMKIRTSGKYLGHSVLRSGTVL